MALFCLLIIILKSRDQWLFQGDVGTRTKIKINPDITSVIMVEMEVMV